MHDDFYQMYLEELEYMKPLTGEEEEALLEAAQKGSKEAKNRLVEGHLKTALACAREFEGQGVLLTDLVQESNMALVLAVEEYKKEESSLEFEAFIKERMEDALRLSVEEEKDADQTGEELAARVNVLLQISQGLAKELGREPDVSELAEKMKMTVEEINSIMKMGMDAMSMNAENGDLEELAQAEGLQIMEERE